MGASLRLGKLFGIPFGVNYSWFVIFGLVTFILGTRYFPSSYPHWPIEMYWLVGLATSLLFFASVVAHELAHSAVSIATGVPVKGITLFFFGGVAQLEREASRPRNEFMVAIAGPLASLGIGLLFGGLFYATRGVSEPVAALSQWLAWINLSLAAFNLAPAFPMDGGRVLRSIIWRVNGSFLRATRIASITGRAGGYLCLFGGLLIVFQGLQANNSGLLWDGLWITFIGWFLENMARSSYRQTAMQHGLSGLTARDLISEFPAISPGLSVGEFVREHLMRSAQRTYLVVEGQHPLGLISPQGIKGLPRGQWDAISVKEAMVTFDGLQKAEAGEDAATLLDLMDRLNLNQLPVEEEGHILGLVRRESILHLIQTRRELGV